MKTQCSLCGSRHAGLIQDPGRDNDYVCATCLFTERDSLDATIKNLRRQISELKETIFRLHQEKDAMTKKKVSEPIDDMSSPYMSHDDW